MGKWHLIKEVLDSTFNWWQNIYILTTYSLNQRWNMSTPGVRHLDGSIWPVWDAHQHGKYGEYWVPTLSCNRGTLYIGLRPQDDGRGSLLTNKTFPELTLPWLWCVPGGGVPGDPYSGPSRVETGRLESNPVFLTEQPRPWPHNLVILHEPVARKTIT